MVLEYVTPNGSSHLVFCSADNKSLTLAFKEALSRKAKIVVDLETGEKYENLRGLVQMLKSLDVDETCVLCEANEIHFEH